MSGRRLVNLTAGLALAGAAIAGYLAYAHYADGRIACPTGDCQNAMASGERPVKS